MNQNYAMLTLASALREMFGVQLYKNNARAILSRMLKILNSDWLQHARSVRGEYEKIKSNGTFCCVFQYCAIMGRVNQHMAVASMMTCKIGLI